MKYPFYLASFCVVLLVIKLCSADDIKSIEQTVDTIASRYIVDDTFAGVQVAVRYRDSEIFNKGYGFANIKEKRPFNQKTVVALGSNTKTFTASAILLLSEQGKISVADEVDQYLPLDAFKNSGITINHLLCHTSGIADIYGKANYGQVNHLSLRNFIKKS